MRRPVVALVIAGLLIATAAPSVLAKTTRIDVAGTVHPVGVLNPGTSTTHGNITWTRGFTLAEVSDPAPTNDSHVAGYQEDVINWVVDLKANRGLIWGTGVHRPEAYPDGTWKCAFAGMIVNFAPPVIVWAGNGVCQGTGSLHGWRWVADLSTTPDGGTAMHGYIVFAGR